ncbi:hypothetical protein TRVA0_015S01134 [Trichomonascus vanleenenianus]|uniref:uncharacterized protein n=1 Tax=Trichomonascus vanleenenianus TaxID=2268995 RepID=UPI003EC9FD79
MKLAIPLGQDGDGSSRFLSSLYFSQLQHCHQDGPCITLNTCQLCLNLKKSIKIIWGQTSLTPMRYATTETQYWTKSESKNYLPHVKNGACQLIRIIVRKEYQTTTIRSAFVLSTIEIGQRAMLVSRIRQQEF